MPRAFDVIEVRHVAEMDDHGLVRASAEPILAERYRVVEFNLLVEVIGEINV